MTDEKETKRTPKEIAANVKKLEAEAEQALAAARLSDAEVRVADAAVRLDAEAIRSAAVRSEQDELKMELVREGERKRMAADEYHRVYHFDTAVSGATASAAIAVLTEWHRLDPECDIEVVFDSGGGDVISGFRLFDFLVDLGDRGHKVTTGCTGMAASMAGILVQAGAHRWMSRESWYMIHQAAFGASGKTFDVEDTVEWVKRIQERIVKIFASRSNLTASKIKANWKRKDWWIDSDEALEHGLVDEIRASHLPGVSAKKK